jgi:hypothetical protein
MLPRLELTEDSNKKNDFIIFRHQIRSKKVVKSKVARPNKVKHKRTKTRKHKSGVIMKHKTRKHKRKTIFSSIIF